MTTNWEELEEKMGPKFKDYAEDGKYKVKCNSIEIKEVGTNGAIIMRFGFEETDVQFPTADHWLTFKEGKDNWRKWHNRCLMMVLGATKEGAQKAVDMAESKDGKDNKVKAYEACYKKLLAKTPTVEIEVYTEFNQDNGKNYARAEFTDSSVAMPHGDDNKPSKSSGEVVSPSSIKDDALDGAEEIELNDMPF